MFWDDQNTKVENKILSLLKMFLKLFLLPFAKDKKIISRKSEKSVPLHPAKPTVPLWE